MKDKIKKVARFFVVRKRVAALVAAVLIVAGAFGVKATDNEQMVIDAIVNVAEVVLMVTDATEMAAE